MMRADHAVAGGGNCLINNHLLEREREKEKKEKERTREKEREEKKEKRRKSPMRGILEFKLQNVKIHDASIQQWRMNQKSKFP